MLVCTTHITVFFVVKRMSILLLLYYSSLFNHLGERCVTLIFCILYFKVGCIVIKTTRWNPKRQQSSTGVLLLFHTIRKTLKSPHCRCKYQIATQIIRSASVICFFLHDLVSII